MCKYPAQNAANEYQLIQLLPLPTAELQREAWQRARAHSDRPGSKILRETVRALQTEQAGDRIAPRLIPDNTFPGASPTAGNSSPSPTTEPESWY